MLVAIMGAVDIIAAVLLALYAGHLGQWVWLIIAVLVFKGFMSFLGLLAGG